MNRELDRILIRRADEQMAAYDKARAVAEKQKAQSRDAVSDLSVRKEMVKRGRIKRAERVIRDGKISVMFSEGLSDREIAGRLAIDSREVRQARRRLSLKRV